MLDYRKGIKRARNVNAIHEQMKQERMQGDSIYIIALRHGYNPVYICRLFKELPIKKHANRHKLFWSKK
jgi:hypothetical protein